MINQEDRIKNVSDVIDYAEDLYAFYYSDRNQKMGLRFNIKGFTENDGVLYKDVMNQIAEIISKMSKIHEDYKSKTYLGANLYFSKGLENNMQKELFSSIFIEFSKLKDINVIEYLQEDIEQRINYLKEIWKIDDIIISTWRDYLGTDDNEAYRRLVEENEVLKRKIEDISSKLEIAKKLGYVPLYSLPNNLLIPKK